MMDTILNVGLTTDNLVEWGDRIGVRAAWDSYRRLIQMLGSTAYGVSHDKFEFQLAKIKKDAGVKEDWELNVTQLQTLVSRYKHVFSENTKQEFPDTRGEQMRAAICAVFESWMNPRAIEYRKIHKIPESMGTAVTVQAMVFGNMGEDSGTGVLFTRDPSTGQCEIMGEFLTNAQGEDVVAGIRTPVNIHEMEKLGPGWEGDYNELIELVCEQARRTLQRHDGHRVHRAAGQALDAAVSRRQALGAGGVQDRPPVRRRGRDHEGRGVQAAHAGAVQAGAAAADRGRVLGRAPRCRQGRMPWGGDGQGRCSRRRMQSTAPNRASW